MVVARRWKSSDLDVTPDDGRRYEIIDGELYVSKQPHWYHQKVCVNVVALLDRWGAGQGEVNLAPGVIFADDDDVAPDVVWASKERLAAALWPDGKLHAAPELIVEVLSPGAANERRDREPKLTLYSRRGVREYWIVDWQSQRVDVFRRQEAVLVLVHTLFAGDRLESPLFPGRSAAVSALFESLHGCPS
jgi:Uma2 family endonuclease